MSGAGTVRGSLPQGRELRREARMSARPDAGQFRPTRSNPGFRVAWGLLLALCAVFAAIFAASVVFGLRGEDFRVLTGRDLEEFRAANPAVAGYIDDLVRVAGLGFLSLVVLVAIIIWTGLRHRDRWAARPLWILPAALAVLAIVVFDPAETGRNLYYAGLALVTAGLVFWSSRYVRR